MDIKKKLNDIRCGVQYAALPFVVLGVAAVNSIETVRTNVNDKITAKLFG